MYQRCWLHGGDAAAAAKRFGHVSRLRKISVFMSLQLITDLIVAKITFTIWFEK